MNLKLTRNIVICALFIAQQGYADMHPEAKVLNTKGAVMVDGQPASFGGTIKQGQTVATGDDGAVLLNLAAGQFVYIYKNSTASIAELKYGQSGTERQSVVKLIKGSMNSEVRKPVHGTTSHKVQTSSGTIEAKGTAWSSSMDGGSLSVSVYSGTVSYSFEGIGSVSISQGSVATFSGGVLLVVNLTTGTTMTYSEGQAPVPGVASATVLALAAGTFGNGASAFTGMATEADQTTFAQVVGAINTVLAGANVPALVGNNDALFPAGLTLGVSGLGAVASPTDP